MSTKATEKVKRKQCQIQRESKLKRKPRKAPNINTFVNRFFFLSSESKLNLKTGEKEEEKRKKRGGVGRKKEPK